MAKRTTQSTHASDDTVFEPPVADAARDATTTLACIYCECTEDDACETDDGPCSWISLDPPVCSAPDCVKAHEARARDDEANPPVAEREASPAPESGTSVDDDVPAVEDAPALAPVELLEVDINDIAFDAHQARDEGVDEDLAPSIKANGVRQPVEIRPHPFAGEFALTPDGKATTHQRYMLVDGERRWRGAAKAGLTTIPARLVHDANDEGDRLLRQNLLNDGKRLKPMEEARSWARIMKAKGWKIAQLATALGRPKSTISDRLALLDAPKPFQELFAKGILTPAAAPIVREYRDVPERILKEAIEDASDTLWYDYIENGIPVPVDDVRDELESQLLYAHPPRLRPIDAKLAPEYAGGVATIKGKKYAVDVATYDKIINTRTPAAGSAPPATPERNLYQDEQRKLQKAAHKRAELRRAQFTAVSAKMPKALDAGWLLFVIRGLLQEMHNDSRRAVCKALGLEPQKKGKLAGFNFDAALRKHAEGQDLAGRNRLVVQLLLGNDLATGPNDGGSATRLAEVAKLLKLDLAKIKPAVYDDEQVPINPRVVKALAKARAQTASAKPSAKKGRR